MYFFLHNFSKVVTIGYPPKVILWKKKTVKSINADFKQNCSWFTIIYMSLGNLNSLILGFFVIKEKIKCTFISVSCFDKIKWCTQRYTVKAQQISLPFSPFIVGMSLEWLSHNSHIHLPWWYKLLRINSKHYKTVLWLIDDIWSTK